MLIIVGFIALCLNVLLLTYRYLYASYHVQEIILTLNLFYILLVSLLPFLWWVYSTKNDEWHFYNRKKATLALCIANATMAIGQTIWTFVFDTLVMQICKIPTGRNLDAEMLFILCRIALMGITGAFFYFVFFICRKLYENVEIKENIESIRWQHLFDTRSNKNEAYDIDYIRDINTGKPRIVYEGDRFVHMFIVGASGTGKTSSTILKSIVCDLNKKVDNMQKRVPKLIEFLKAGKGTAYAEENKAVDEYSIVPEKEYAQEFEAIRKSAPDCGLTFMAPDGEAMEDVIKLTKARNIPINVIDPVFDHTEEHVRMVGINPFYVELGLDYKTRQTDIVNKAQNAAEVLLAVSEIHGVGDQYFRDINQSVTTSVSIVCMLHANLNGRQTNITEIQSCIADFGRLTPIVKDIQEKLHMHIKVHDLGGSKSKENANKVTAEDINKPEDDELVTDDITFDEASCDEEVPEEFRAQGMGYKEYNKRLRDEGEGYAEPIHNVLMELLGPGSEFMFQQARGLRNILGNLLLNSNIRKTLAAPDDAVLDFDKAFSRGEITVINTAQEISTMSSTALGLFILLTMKQCALRRPKANRINHYLYVDEASQYMHPLYEDMFAQFRKFKVGCTLAVQALSQFEKNSTTKYLKGVLLGAGIHVVFGRIDPDSMKYYELLSGVVNKETVQTQLNSNSEFDDNYSVTSGRRKTLEEKAAVAGADIRTRDFQEVTVYMVKAGRVLKGFHAKTSFVPKKEFRDRKLPTYDFAQYAVDSPKHSKIRQISKENEIAREELEKFKVRQTVSNIRPEEDAVETLPSFDASDDLRRITRESPEIVKQRQGYANMLLNSVDDVTSYNAENSEDRFVEDFDVLPATMLGNNKKPSHNKVVKLEDVIKDKTAEHIAKKEKTEKNQTKVKDDYDFGSLLSDDSAFSDVKDDIISVGSDDELSDEEYLAAELERLNSDRKDI